ncbi:hypothetical protein KAU11_05365, partial [Candidatus Babeliales bacterium]|nr:hypothetical protein [Candidatus Babeliales bacterium]
IAAAPTLISAGFLTYLIIKDYREIKKDYRNQCQKEGKKLEFWKYLNKRNLEAQKQGLSDRSIFKYVLCFATFIFSSSSLFGLLIAKLQEKQCIAHENEQIISINKVGNNINKLLEDLAEIEIRREQDLSEWQELLNKSTQNLKDAEDIFTQRARNT